MTNPTFPTSFRDPVYAAADQAASEAAGIPPGLLQSIRTVGERSNANQVSSAGATTPYQITPDTRGLIIKKYGIDPSASPEAAALGAAYLLKEGMQRTGSAAGAVTQYIGGTDPENWGTTTRAYTNRVMSAFTKGGGQDTPQVSAPSGAELPSAASYGIDPTIAGASDAQGAPSAAPIPQVSAAAPGASTNAQIVADYNAGRLSQSDMDAVDARAAKIGIDPSTLVRPSAPASDPAAPKIIGPQTLQAIQNGTLTPDQLQIVQAGIQNGTLTLPQGASMSTPSAQGVPSQTADDQSGWNPLGGVPTSWMPTAPQTPTTAAQNGSTLSDVAERATGGVIGGLLDIAAAGGRLVGANDFANGAVEARNQINDKIARDTNNSVAGKIAGAVGSSVPYLAGGASLPTAIAGGAVAGAVPSIAENKSGVDTLRDAAVGGAAGAAGFGVGKALGSIVSSIAENPTVARGISAAQRIFGRTPSEATQVAASGGAQDANVAAEIAKASGNTPESLATKIDAAPVPQTPGYTPSAAELANDANVTAVQKASTNAQAPTYANASADNDAAIAASLDTPSATPVGAPANAQVVDQAAEAAAQKSDALASQGQTEVAPITNAIAQKLQTPQFDAPVKLARKIAADEGSTVFTDLDQAKQAAAADTLQQIIGTPEELAQARAARGAQAADDFLSTHVGIPADSPQLQSLLKKPAMRAALGQAETTAANEGAPGIYTTAQKSAVMTGSGAQTPQTYISGRALANAKVALDDQIGAATRAGEAGQARTLQTVKQQLLGVLDSSIPEYAKARAAYAEASGPIDAMQALQTRLYSAVDPTTGEVSANKLVGAINSIKGEQMKPGIRPADKVPKDTLDALSELASHLQNKNDLTGLPGEGQEFIRRALASNEKHAAAQAEFRSVLDAQSPAYAELHGGHAQTTAAIASQQTSQRALAQAQETIANAETPAGLRSLDKILPSMEPADQAKAIALRQVRARELAMNEVQARNLNSRGQTEFNRGTFQNAAKKYGEFMSAEDAQRFNNVSSDLLRQTTTYAKTGKIAGSDTAQNLSLAKRFTGNVGAALKDAAVQAALGGVGGMVFGPVGGVVGAASGVLTSALSRAITEKVSAISTENAAKLLSNGKLLSAALKNYQSVAARRAFVQALGAKVGYAGGAAAANQFNGRK